jgi:hypothetical protein
VASLEFIKNLGTNGGFFNANGRTPMETLRSIWATCPVAMAKQHPEHLTSPAFSLPARSFGETAMNSKHVQILRVLIVLIGCACAARASSREIVFPFTGGYLVGDPNSLAFTPDGKLGFALLIGADNIGRRLFSFSVTDSNVVSVAEIASDLAGTGGAGFVPAISISVDYRAGLLFVYGTDTATNEKVICFAFDHAGELTRLWSANYAGPQILSSGTELAFSTDGSRAFIVYSHSERGTVVNKLDLRDAGSVV